MRAGTERPGRFLATTLAWGTLLVAATVGLADDKKPQHTAVKPTPQPNRGWMKRHEGFLARAKKGHVDVLFLGDSITHGWEGAGKDVWKDRFEPLHAANFGIGGDQTQHVLWRITEGKELEGIQPKVAVIMIGTNNMGSGPPLRAGPVGKGGNSVEQIADGVTAIVHAIRHRSPDTKILLTAIFPRAEKPTAPVRAKIKAVNERLAKLGDHGKHVLYLDIGDKFLDKDGTLTKEIMPDYLHLSAKGYGIWADAIQPALQDLLKQ